MRSLSSTLVRNALFGSGARLVTLAVGLFLTPYLLMHLGKERFGIWALVSVVTGAVGLLDFSLKTSFVKYLAEAIALGDKKASSAILSTGLLAYLVFAATVAVLFSFGCGLMLTWLQIPEKLQGEAQHVFFVGMAGYLIASVFSVFPAVCDAKQRMDVTNSLGVLSLILGTFLTVLALNYGLGLQGVAWAQFLGILSFYILAVFAARKLSGPLGISPFQVNRIWLRRLLAFGGKLHISTICTVVNRQLDKLILSRWAGLSYVGSYEIALRAASNAGTLQPFLAAALLPASSHLNAEGRKKELLAVYKKATKYLFLVGIPPFVYLAAYSDTFITAWLGQPDNHAAMILLCLAIGYMLNSLSNGMAFVCQGVGQPGIQSRQSAVQLAANVALSLLLFHLLGPIGAPAGTSLALIVGAIYFARKFHGHLGISTTTLLRETAIIPLGGSLSGVGIAWLLTGDMVALERGEAVVKLALSLTVFMSLLLSICLLTGYIGRSEVRGLLSAFEPEKERVSL